MNGKRKPVLIVGAGPVGLLIANGLAANNVPFDIVERKPGPSTESKGLAVNIGSQVVLELCGIAESFGSHGCKIRRFDIYWNRRRFSSINFTHLPREDNYLITQPQWVTENELIGALEKRGRAVRWSHELVGLEQTGSGVTVHLQRGGDEITEQYEYVVGCDGKHSKVRPYVSPNSESTQYDMYFVLGDFQLEKRIPRDTVQYQVFRDGFFILVPISDKLTRVVVKHNGAPPNRPLQDKDIKSYVNKYSGTTLIDSEPHWISRAPFYNSVCEKMQNDRLFIAGDAAHLFSPIGGTGMNTGFHDSINLLWRLTYVYNGHSGNQLLDLYEAERVPANRAAMIAADTSTKNITDVDSAKNFIKTIAPTMVNRSNFRSHLPAAASGYRYRLNTTGGSHGRTGQYDTALCDYILERRGNPSKSRQLRHTLLISGPDLEEGYLEKVIEHASYYDFLDVLLVDPNATAPDHFLKYGNCHQGRRSVGFNIESILQNDITLVRPDGVIQLECDQSAVHGVFEYLNANFTRNIQPPSVKGQPTNEVPAL